MGRRIGAAQQALNELEQAWKHSGISQRRKLYYFDACVVSNLMYVLQTCWLNEAELKRLDAAYCRMLRRVLNIPASYISRITNIEVYEKAHRYPARYILLERQLILYGCVCRLPMDDILRCSLLVRNSGKSVHYNFKLRGRPHHEWVDKVFENAVKIGVDPLVVSKDIWKFKVKTYVAALAEDRKFFR